MSQSEFDELRKLLAAFEANETHTISLPDPQPGETLGQDTRAIAATLRQILPALRELATMHKLPGFVIGPQFAAAVLIAWLETQDACPPSPLPLHPDAIARAAMQRRAVNGGQDNT